MTQRLLLSVNEVASLLGCGRTYVYGMIQRGELPVVKLGRLTRIPASELEEFVRKQVSLREGDLGSSGPDLAPFTDGRTDHPIRRGKPTASNPCTPLLAGPR
ncbi:MAG: helix-turn-helix domain-containing protein [Candidatus Dormibacteria bacterium]|jgi:excisionase family DNA binding protein